MTLSPKSFVKTALSKASFFVISCVLFLAGCGLGPDPDADGARFNRRFHYYYDQDCRADSFGAFDCGVIRALSPSMTVSLRIDSDGLATLSVDGDHFYFLESEYDEGFDSDFGRYYIFYNIYEDSDELVVYRDGLTLAYWDNFNNTVTYYYYNL